MIKLAPSRHSLIAGRQPALLPLAIPPSGAFSNIRKNLFLTLLNFNDPFELCHQHLIILGKKKSQPWLPYGTLANGLPTVAPVPPQQLRGGFSAALPLNAGPVPHRVCKYRPDEAS